MGTQSHIKLRATVANLIFYERLGEFYIRTKPQKVKQTKATRAKSKVFGAAVTIAKNIRICLAAIIPDTKDRDMQTRLNIAMLAFLNRQQTLAGFEFNAASPLAARFKIKPKLIQTTPASCTIQLPAFNPVESITAPAYTKNVLITVLAVFVNLQQKLVTGSEPVVLTIPYNNVTIPTQQITLLKNNNAAANMVLIAMGLKYNKTNVVTEYVPDARWLPAGIMAYCEHNP
jgi:hypothetical protein